MARCVRLLAAIVLLASVLAGCATTRPVRTGSSPGLEVASSINAWGSILAQLGGSRVHETSIIDKPATDPHDYEPSPADARIIAEASVFVENGVGYDPWAGQAVRADPEPGRTVVDVGKVTGVPTGGNPHRWYSPGDVAKVCDTITAALSRADPAGASYYASRRQAFETTGLADYHQLLGDLKARFAGVPVGASESIVAPLAEAVGLDLITPAGFLRAISQGTDPSTADKATIDTQLRDHRIKVYLYNSQNSTPDVAGQVAAAHAVGIPVVAVTETLTPATASFQQWQAGQLRALESALSAATGR